MTVLRGSLAHKKHLTVQGHLAHNKHPPPRTLQWNYTEGPMVVLGGEGYFL